MQKQAIQRKDEGAAIVSRHWATWFRVRMSDFEIKAQRVDYEYDTRLSIEETNGESLTVPKRSALYAYFPTKLAACEFVESEMETVFIRKRSELYQAEKRLTIATNQVVKAQTEAIQEMHK